jgi:DNA-binding transcriptional LysR family regulator
MTNIDWDKLRVFHIVADAGSLTHAGHSLNISQSAVSRQVSALESSLGVKLFNRHARGLALTLEGDLLYKTSRSIYAQLNNTVAEIIDNRNQAKGTFKLATTIAFGSVWFAKRLPNFFKQYPDMRFEINLTDKEVDFVMREADASIRYGRGQDNKDLFYDKLFDFKLNIYASKNYISQYGKPKNFDDLCNHKLLVFGGYSSPPLEVVNLLLRIGSKPGIVREPFLVLNNAYGLLQAVKSDLGVALLASFIASDHDELVNLFEDFDLPKVEAYLVAPNTMKNSKRLEAIRSFVKEEMFKKI